MAEIKKRYSDEELAEFKEIIEQKLVLAHRDYNDMMKSLRNDEGNDVADTSPTYKILEEGSTTQNRQETTPHPPIRRWKRALRHRPRRSW